MSFVWKIHFINMLCHLRRLLIIVLYVIKEKKTKTILFYSPNYAFWVEYVENLMKFQWGLKLKNILNVPPLKVKKEIWEFWEMERECFLESRCVGFFTQKSISAVNPNHSITCLYIPICLYIPMLIHTLVWKNYTLRTSPQPQLESNRFQIFQAHLNKVLSALGSSLHLYPLSIFWYRLSRSFISISSVERLYAR